MNSASDGKSASSDGFDDITGQWSQSELPSNVRVGVGCWFERKDTFGRFRSQRDPGLVIGNRVQIYTWATFNVEPSGYVEVGDDSILVGPIFMSAESIIVGQRVVLSYNVTIADSDFHPLAADARRLDAIANAPYGDRSTRPPYKSRSVTLEDDVWVGIGAIILKGVRIGKGARVGAGSVITSDVPAGAHFFGNPARPVPSI